MMGDILCCIVNVPARKDRLDSIIQGFSGKEQLHFQVYASIPHEVGAYSLWMTIVRLLKTIDLNLDFFVFCEDDHQFTDYYSFDFLLTCIKRAREIDADILSGGVSWFKKGIQVSDNLFWVEKFSGLQFTVVFKSFYQKILNASFLESDQADYKISELTDKKFVIHPFISTQKDFGYSDVTPRNHDERRVERLFSESSERFDLLRKVRSYYFKNRTE